MCVSFEGGYVKVWMAGRERGEERAQLISYAMKGGGDGGPRKIKGH